MTAMDSLGMFDLNQAAFAQPSTPSARSSGGATQGKPFKSQLHELFQRHNGSSSQTLNFEVTKSTAHPDPYFDCVLRCPELPGTIHGPCDAIEFTGAGRSKKSAENAAAELALIHYASRGIGHHPHASVQPSVAAQTQLMTTLSPMQQSMIMPDQEPPWPIHGIHQQGQPLQQQADQHFQQHIPIMQQQMNQNMHQQILPIQQPHQGLVQIPPQMHQTVQPVYQYAGPAQALNSQAQASMAADSHLWRGNSPNDNDCGKNSIHELALTATGGDRLSSGYTTKEHALSEVEQTQHEEVNFMVEEAEWQALVDSDLPHDALRSHFSKAVAKLVELQKENYLLRREVARRKVVGNEIIGLALCITSNDNESGGCTTGRAEQQQ